MSQCEKDLTDQIWERLRFKKDYNRGVMSTKQQSVQLQAASTKETSQNNQKFSEPTLSEPWKTKIQSNQVTMN